MSNLRYDLDETIDLNNDMQLLYVSADRYDSSWHSIPHTHSCTEFFYCVSGVGQFIINQKSYPVGSDDLIIINSNTEHTEISYDSNPLEYMVLGIANGDILFPQDDQQAWKSINFRLNKDHLLPLLKELQYEIQKKEHNYDKVSAYLVEAILTKIMRYSNIIPSKEHTEKSTKECAEAKRYIDLHFRENVTLDQLAEKVHLNKYYLSHQFTNRYGTSPIKYLFTVRIKESQYLLTKTNYSISQVSQILGFSSASYFSQQFKKQVGMSPRDFKKEQKSS